MFVFYFWEVWIQWYSSEFFLTFCAFKESKYGGGDNIGLLNGYGEICTSSDQIMHELVSALSGRNEFIFHHIHSMTILLYTFHQICIWYANFILKIKNKTSIFSCMASIKQDVKCTTVQIQANCAICKYIALSSPTLNKWSVHIIIVCTG